ncbi:MAG TPA: MFS transporter [Ramlibacter sp.]|nr:MFS transporter [Ramlibacter sp.]
MRSNAAWLVILGGVSAALHVGKLAPALPVLREALGVSLLQAGFLLSLVQLAGMTLGLAVGLAADTLGLKRTMVAGLLVLAGASWAGAGAQDAGSLLALRALEGLGFLLASMPAPGLIRRLVDARRLQAALGLWGAYMPFGTAAALLTGPLVIGLAGWPAWFRLLAVLALAMAIWLLLRIPADPAAATPGSRQAGWPRRLRSTLGARGPWFVALAFALYSGQWLAVIGFLPTVYAQAGIGAAAAGAATALAAAVNIIGNVLSGRLLQQGVAPRHLLQAGFVVMGLGGLVAFAPLWLGEGAAAFAVRLAAVLLFSAVGGMIPGTLFSLAVRLAPSEGTVSTTVGWMQQWSSIGQFAGPPLVAGVATLAGGWQWSWTVTGACALAGLGLASAMPRLLGARGRDI